MYLFSLSYFIFNEIKCTSEIILSIDCSSVLIAAKGLLIGILFSFVDQKFLFLNSSKATP